jgi:curved DNA-binding protein CbpA
MVEENLYSILGLKADASHEDIKTAFRSLAVRHHPVCSFNRCSGCHQHTSSNFASTGVLCNV